MSLVRDVVSSWSPSLSAESIPGASAGVDAAGSYGTETFPYTGGIQTYTAPYTGTYRLRVWGAQGRATGQHLSGSWPGSSGSGKGGYAEGSITLTKGTVLYIVVGGSSTGYNGGGTGSACGGGATHIATATGVLSSLSSNRSAVKIVAGGGGGSEWGGRGTGAGGGASGEPSQTYTGGTTAAGAGGGTQTAGGAAGTWFGNGYAAEDGSFGQGGSGRVASNPTTDPGPGGGGGWYGGGGQAYTGLGGGGSGYIGGVTGGSMQTGVREGDGYAEITRCNELIVDPHGGVWDDGETGPSPDVRSFNEFTGTRRIADPTREGYRFVGWVEVGSGRLDNVKGTNGDGTMEADTNNTAGVYNNEHNGSVTHTRMSGETPYGDHFVRISHSATVSSSPQLGGFYYSKQAVAGETYLVVFCARVPTGFYLQHSTNYIGEDATETWLTDRKGTGEWRTYAYKATIGQPRAGTSLSTTGFVFLTRDPDSEWGSTTKANLGPAAEDVSWDLAYTEMYDVTSGTSFTFRDGVASSSVLIAQWEPVSYKVTYHYGNDDAYKAGQSDVLGARMDLAKDNRVTGTVVPSGGSGDVLLVSTLPGASGLSAYVSADGRLSISDGTDVGTSQGTLDASEGIPFTFHWDATARQASVTDGSFLEERVARRVYDGIVPETAPGIESATESEVMMRVGSADASGAPLAPVRVSDVTWRTTYALDEEFELPAPTRLGYEFLGWYPTPALTGTDWHGAHEVMRNLATEGETHLYAKWRVRSYVVSFDANGGAGGMPSQEMTWNASEPLSHCTMLRFNWRFTGWNTEPDGSGTAYADDQVVSNILEKPVETDNDYRITLYAQWEKVSNTSQIEDGLWEIRVPAWGKVSVSNLPAGASFEVVEQPQQDWVLTSQENTSGTIAPRTAEVAKFQNEYRPNETSLALAATKTLDGVSPVGSEFSFTLSGADEQTTAKLEASLGGEATETVSNSGGGIQFSPVAYDGDDVGKTFRYVIREVAGDDPAIEYSDVAKEVTVTVTTGATGLVATADYPDLGGQTAVFANRTKPGSLRVVKEVVGATEAAERANSFPVTVALSDPAGSPLSGSYDVTLNGIAVDGVAFDEGGQMTVTVRGGDELVVSSIPAGTRYAVTESFPEWFRQEGAEGVDGVIRPDEQAQATLTNRYSASGQTTVTATKHLLGATLAEDEFSFRLTDGDGAVVGVATNAADGTVEFPPIAYDEGDDGRTFGYVMTEDDDGREDVAYDAREVAVTVSVRDEEGEGVLAVSVSYDDPDGATFENEMLVEMATTGGNGAPTHGAILAILSAAAAATAVHATRRRRDKSGTQAR